MKFEVTKERNDEPGEMRWIYGLWSTDHTGCFGLEGYFDTEHEAWQEADRINKEYEDWREEMAW